MDREIDQSIYKMRDIVHKLCEPARTLAIQFAIYHYYYINVLLLLLFLLFYYYYLNDDIYDTL